MDLDLMQEMSPDELEKYYKNLIRRRMLAHERDLNEEPTKK